MVRRLSGPVQQGVLVLLVAVSEHIKRWRRCPGRAIGGGCVVVLKSYSWVIDRRAVS